MAGFDASKYLAPELPLAGAPAEPVGKWRDAEPVSPPVAGVAASLRLDDGTLVDPETGEILDVWETAPGAVAGVAGVAATQDLPLTAPFARELNEMFSYPAPAWLKRGVWKKLCEAVRLFTETKAETALALGWEPIELYGVHRYPWQRTLAVNGVLWTAAGRGIGTVEAHAIEIINKMGAHQRAYRAHLMSQRHRSALMWEAFHPSNARPDNMRA